MNWYVYILFCDQKIYYVGSTNNIQRRIIEHKTKQSNFTHKFSDIRLVYEEKLAEVLEVVEVLSSDMMRTLGLP